MNKKLDQARESYIESLQMTIKHEIFTRVKTCMMIINKISAKLVSIKENKVKAQVQNSCNFAKIEMS